MSIQNNLFYQCQRAKSKLLWFLFSGMCALGLIKNGYSYVNVGTLNRIGLDQQESGVTESFSYGLRTSNLWIVSPYWRVGPGLLVESGASSQQLESGVVQYHSKTAALGLSQQFFYVNIGGNAFLTFNADLFWGLSRSQITYDQKTEQSFSESTIDNVHSTNFYAFFGPAVKFKHSLEIAVGGFFRQENFNGEAGQLATTRVERVDGTSLNLYAETEPAKIALNKRRESGVYLNLTYRFAE